jgi:S-adenosylmethionine decarboxylase
MRNAMADTTDTARFEFYGRHLLLNFRGCRADLNDVERLKQDMISAVTSVGATVLNCVWHKFEPNGVSLVLLLAESHASVHTYPEERACFIDLFTCGRRIRVEPFAQIMAERWQPETVSRELRERCDPDEPRAHLARKATA